MSQRCQAKNCNSNRSTVKFFNFPSDVARKKLWIKVCERDPDWFPASRNQKLCQEHFNADQFENRRVDGLRKLKWNAIPTVKSSMLTRSETTVKVEDPTYGIKTEPLYQGYEERLMSSVVPDEITNESKPNCQICDRPLESYPNNLCKVCEKKFEFDQELNIQKKKNRMVIKYQCDECLKAFSNVNTYQRHIKCHDEKKPYRCNQCQKRFYHSKDLLEHTEMHETSFNISSVPIATQSSLCLINAHTVSNEDRSITTTSKLKHEPSVEIKLETNEELSALNPIGHGVQPITVSTSLKELSTVEHDTKIMFENPYNPLPMVQIENFELFGSYQERENETVSNDVFYEGSVSPTSSSTISNTERCESIIKIEGETLHSSADYDSTSVFVGQMTGNEQISMEYEINEIKEETTEQATDQSEETQRECYICSHCNKDFMYYGNFAKHLEQHSIGKLMCKFCNQMFGNTYQIRKHIRDYHSNQEMFDCSVCFTTLPKHYFASHMRNHRSDDKTLICKYCGCRFSEPSELFYHFKNRHSDSTESNVTTNSKNEETAPIQPIEEVVGTEKYKCKYCGIKFDDVIKMYHHVKVHIKHTGTAKRMISTSSNSN